MFTLLCVTTTASAQTLQAHLAYSQGTHTQFEPGLVRVGTPRKAYLISAPDGRVSYGAGITGRFGYADLKPFFAQVELSGFYQKANFEVRDSLTNTVFSTYQKERYRIDVPIQLGVKFWWVRVQAGLAPSIAIPEAGVANDFGAWWSEAFNGGNIAYCYGVGLDVANLVSVDVRYQNDLGKRPETTLIPDFGTTGRHYYNNGLLVVKLGVRISKEKE